MRRDDDDGTADFSVLNEFNSYSDSAICPLS
jgi:hypothetical protein